MVKWDAMRVWMAAPLLERMRAESRAVFTCEEAYRLWYASEDDKAKVVELVVAKEREGTPFPTHKQLIEEWFEVNQQPLPVYMRG